MNESEKKIPHLKRKVNLFALTMYGVGNILGAGIYALIGQVVGITGTLSWLSFVLAAVIGAFTGLSYAELSSMFPKSAAEFVYTENAFKIRILSFILGWIIIFSGLFSTATVAFGFAGYLASLIGVPSNLLVIPIAITLIIILSIVNYIGIKTSTWTNIIFTSIEAAGLIFIIIIGIPHFGSVNYIELPIGSNSLVIFSSIALIFFAYIGFEDIANIAEEVKNPTRNLPRAIIYSLIITTILYGLTAISVVSIVPYYTIATSPEPLSLVAITAIGPIGRYVISFIALFATANTVLIMLIVTSRMMYGMARDKALPVSLSKISKKHKTPTISVFISMILVIGMFFLGGIDSVARATVFGVLINFILVNISLITLRKKNPEIERPFKLKPSVGFIPLISLLGAIVCGGLLLFTLDNQGNFDWWTLLIYCIIILAGVAFFYLLKPKIETKTPK
jgi:APA family basic amino acid/polyamine antiporter